MYILKHKMLKYCMGALADKLELPGDMRDQMHCVLQSHSKYRECLHPREDGAKPPDLTWRAGWPRSAIMFLTFVETLVYGEDFDTVLRIAVRSSKSPADVMEYDTISSKWADILETHKKQMEGSSAAAAAAGDGDSTAGQSRLRDEEGRACATAAGDAAGDQEPVDKLQQEAERTVNSNILLVVEPESQTELKQKIMSSFFGKLVGKEHQECPWPSFLSHACNLLAPPQSFLLLRPWGGLDFLRSACRTVLPPVRRRGTSSWCMTSSKRPRARRRRTCGWRP